MAYLTRDWIWRYNDMRAREIDANQGRYRRTHNAEQLYRYWRGVLIECDQGIRPAKLRRVALANAIAFASIG